jgi:hypothetical protein
VCVVDAQPNFGSSRLSPGGQNKSTSPDDNQLTSSAASVSNRANSAAWHVKLLSLWETPGTNVGEGIDRQTAIVDAFHGGADATLTPSLAAPRADSLSSALTDPIRIASLRCRAKFVG